MYCCAFGAEITRDFKNEDNTAYEHCELSVNGEGFMVLAEANNPCGKNCRGPDCRRDSDKCIICTDAYYILGKLYKEHI